MIKYGVFYGIGVGPGEPELITLKAQRILRRVKYVFTPVAKKRGKSRAYQIAKQFIPAGTVVKSLHFPMTRDRKECELAWMENVEKIVEVLLHGGDVAFITLGDPMTYSTYGYLLKIMKVRYPYLQFTTIPGIPSYIAVAAAANLPLVQGEEVLVLIPGNTPPYKVRQLVKLADTAVFIKHYRETGNILSLLGKMGSGMEMVYMSQFGFGDQVFVNLHSNKGKLEKGDYLSLLIVKKPSR